MLFSEPKIPQFGLSLVERRTVAQFQCSSASRKFLNSSLSPNTPVHADGISVLFSEPKIPQLLLQCERERVDEQISVLFSEPKIPQLLLNELEMFSVENFSALQRAENSSIWGGDCDEVGYLVISVLFSEPKIPQFIWATRDCSAATYFSALQRAENSSIHPSNHHARHARPFQCSSASRKFLN